MATPWSSIATISGLSDFQFGFTPEISRPSASSTLAVNLCFSHVESMKTLESAPLDIPFLPGSETTMILGRLPSPLNWGNIAKEKYEIGRLHGIAIKIANSSDDRRPFFMRTTSAHLFSSPKSDFSFRLSPRQISVKTRFHPWLLDFCAPSTWIVLSTGNASGNSPEETSRLAGYLLFTYHDSKDSHTVILDSEDSIQYSGLFKSIQCVLSHGEYPCRNLCHLRRPIRSLKALSNNTAFKGLWPWNT